MAVQLMKLRGVPDDEADEIRALLDAHGIRHYETPPGAFRISMPAIWLPDSTQEDEAKELLRDYQERRYACAQENADNTNIWQSIRENPLGWMGVAAAISIVVALSLWPFVSLFP